MNTKRSGNHLPQLCFCLLLLISLSPAVLARPSEAPEDASQEASPSQAQATMASLFSRGAKIPTVPHIGGTLALPSFDSAGLKIDEIALSEVQRQETNDQRPAARD